MMLRKLCVFFQQTRAKQQIYLAFMLLKSYKRPTKIKVNLVKEKTDATHNANGHLQELSWPCP